MRKLEQMRAEIIKLHELNDAMNHLHVAFTELDRKSQSMNDIVSSIFEYEYPFESSFEDITADVTKWTASFEKSIIEHEHLVEFFEKQNSLDYKPHDADLSKIVNFLYWEDVDFNMEYNCPQYDINILHGKDTNKIFLQNSPIEEDVIHCMYLNDNLIFKDVDVKKLIAQLQITLKIIR